MRKCAALLIILLIFAQAPALAEQGYIYCLCELDECVCFIQLGDEGMAIKRIITELIDQGYLDEKTSRSIYDENVQGAVALFQYDNYLRETGVMDDETLTLLLWGMTVYELDEFRPESDPSPMWIPTDGGIRRHNTNTCSNMYDPRLISARNAELIGMDLCDHCVNQAFDYVP